MFAYVIACVLGERVLVQAVVLVKAVVGLKGLQKAK